MKKSDRNFAIGVVAYVLIGFLTFGYVGNRNAKNADDPVWGLAGLCGIGWPVYWLGKGVYWLGNGSIELTKPAPSTETTVEKETR